MANVSMKVVNASEVERAFGKILKAFQPPQLARIMRVGADVLVEEVKDKILEQDLVESGDMYNSVQSFMINQYAAGVKVDVVYAAVHEYGLPNQVATPKQIRFFWAMYGNTGDAMWKALALKGSYTIPARPYFRPAIDEGKDKALLAIMKEAASVLTRMARIGG